MMWQPDPREGKLPQWAQHELQKARRDLESERQKSADLARVADGVIIRDPYENSVPVARLRETLRIVLPDRGYLDMRWTGDWLEVRGFSGLEIQPQMSNVVRVRNAEYWRPS